MSKRKQLSAEEKRVKLLELFHETNEVYQLKDIERLAPHEKGIVLQSVKTTLQELVDNGLVESAKISGSTYFWSFPNNNFKKLQMQLDDVVSKTAKVQDRLNSVQELNTHKNDLRDMTAIEGITSEIEVLIKEKQMLNTKIEGIQSDVDYEEIKRKMDDTKTILDAANRWTDNIFMIKTWCKRKFDKQEKDLNKAFGIPEELDYVDV